MKFWTPLAAAFIFAMATTAQTTSDDTSLPNLSSALASQSAAESSTEGTTSASTSSGTSTTTGATTTGTSTTASIIGVTGLPTLTGIASIVTPIVPNTANAPFMQTSRLPEGTVFIIVGALLGFIAMTALLWRGLVALSLKRSVRYAEKHQGVPDAKMGFRTPAPPFYNYMEQESRDSLAKGGKRKTHSRKGNSNAASQSTTSLFFSPTAGANAGGLRGSAYLPAGYYAAGAAAAGNGQSTTQIGGNHNSISLSNLVPQSQGYARARSVGPSPPESPRMGVTGHGGRAPSAYLDNLIDGEGGRETAREGRGPPAPRHHPRASGGRP